MKEKLISSTFTTEGIWGQVPAEIGLPSGTRGKELALLNRGVGEDS